MTNSSFLRTIRYRDIEIKYVLTRKQVKNINLRINADKEILVSAPNYVKAEDLDRFVLSKSEKILSILKSTDLEENSDIQYVSGDEILVLGEKVILDVNESAKDGGVFGGNTLYLNVRGGGEFVNRQRAFRKWENRFLSKMFEEKCKQMHALFVGYKVPYPQITIRTMKTRWGSCTPKKKKITLNAKLLEKPIECIEYVIVHELAHFVQANHSAKFYAVLDKVLPDWKERKKRLNS